MNLIITRSFPPSVGGIQNLMWGLAKSISGLDMLKVFADYELIMRNLIMKYPFLSKELEVLNFSENSEKHT